MTEKTAVAKTTPPGERILETLLGLAKTPQEREHAYLMAERVRQQRMIATMSEALAEISWGEKISPIARAQVVRYALEIGADPTRHLYVLGNRVYLNGAYFQELVAVEPDFLRGTVEWLHDDDRAGEEERERRKNLRVEHAVPEQVTGKPVLAAALVTLHFQTRGPFTGVKWSPSNKNDPVGTEFPTLAAETRAWRRAAMKAVSPWFRTHGLERAEDVLRWSHAQDKTSDAVAVRQASRPPMLEDEPPLGMLPADAHPIETAEPLEARPAKHQPSAVCPTEGEHPLAACGYYAKQPAV
jgi:hypothetical protein